MPKELDAVVCAQAERTERAQTALANNQFLIAQKTPASWMVQNGDKQPYDVHQDAQGWSCTCQDYQKNGGRLRCKHIEAVRLSAANKTQIHKEVTMSELQETVGGWIKLFHPAGGGVQVTLPVPPAPFTQTQAQAMFTNVGTLIAAGFMVNLPGLEEGEKREAVTHIVRRRKAEDGGGSVPVMDIYAGGNFRVLSVYLDNDKPELVSEFVDLLGPLARFKVYPSNAPLERGKDAETDREYVVPVSDRGVQIVYKANPKYDEAEADRLKAENKAYKVPKRIFVRFEKDAAAAIATVPVPAVVPATTPANNPAPAPAAGSEEKILTDLGYPTERVYLNGEKVNGNIAEQDAFDSFKKAFNGSVPGSKEALRTWISGKK